MVISMLIGAVLGTLAGLGVGGGSILMLWLTIVQDVTPAVARGINLMFFVVAAGSVTIIRRKKGLQNYSRILPAIISGCIAAAVCAYLSVHIDTEILRTILGILFLITGVKELLYRPTKAK